MSARSAARGRRRGARGARPGAGPRRSARRTARCRPPAPARRAEPRGCGTATSAPARSRPAAARRDAGCSAGGSRRSPRRRGPPRSRRSTRVTSKPPPSSGRTERDLGVLADRRVEAGDEAGQPLEDLLAHHEPVRVGAVVLVAGQPALEVRRHQAERVPARVGPGMHERVAFEDDVLDAVALEVPAHREAGLPAADDHHRDALGHDATPAMQPGRRRCGGRAGGTCRPARRPAWPRGRRSRRRHPRRCRSWPARRRRCRPPWPRRRSASSRRCPTGWPTPRAPGSRAPARGRTGRSVWSSGRRPAPAGGVRPRGRPGRHAADDLGAVDGQGPRRLRERLVVTDHHADPPDRGVEGLEAVTGGVRRALAERLVHLAVDAEHAVAGDRDRGVEARSPSASHMPAVTTRSPARSASRRTSGPSGSSAGGSEWPPEPSRLAR